MNKLKIFVLVITCICIAPLPAGAGDYDGSKPLLCSVIEIYEYTANYACEQVTVEEIGFTYFLKIDFSNKKITGTRTNGQPVNSQIRDKVSMNGMLILQGMENGRGWTLAITEATGKMVMTVSGDEEAFVVFGACMPR